MSGTEFGDYGPPVVSTHHSIGRSASAYYGYPSDPYYSAYRSTPQQANFGSYPPPLTSHHSTHHSYAEWPQRLDSAPQPQRQPSRSSASRDSTAQQSNSESMELTHLGVLQNPTEGKQDSMCVQPLSMLGLTASQPQPPSNLSLNNNAAMDSNITLWQFLLEMLTKGEHPDLIQWTNNDGEFKLLDAESVARLWGIRKGKHQMNYDKLSRALRYYYDKNIIKKVNGQKFVYRFVHGAESAGTPDSLSYSMQRSMGIHRGANVLGRGADSAPLPNTLAPPSVLPRPSAIPMQFFRRNGTPSSSCALDTDLTSRPLTVSNANANSTPSPINSTCSPGSVGSSSGVSSAGTSASNLSDVYHHNAQQHPGSAPSGPSSRPSSTASTAAQSASRKRKREEAIAGVEKIKIESASSNFDNGFLNTSPNSGSGRRPRPKPVPLDLTAVSNVDAGANVMNNLLAASPLLQNSPALLNFYAASLSASMMSQPSPLASFPAALASPLHLAAAAAVAASPTLNVNSMSNNNNLSMFGNSLSALTTPIPMRTPQHQPNTTQSQFFQFPPSSQAAQFALAAAMLTSPSVVHSPLVAAMGLCTPNAQNTLKFNMSPDALKTPVIREI